MTAPAAQTREQSITHLVSIVGQGYAQLCCDNVMVAPADTAQVAEILRFANANGLVVTPSGAGTKLGWGNNVDWDIKLLLERLHAVCEHSWQDMTCTVQAGCTWAKLQSEVARHGQMVALDPLWPDRATVGGIIATSDSGALRLKFGGLRDLIIGMTIVLADGTIAKTGGRVVKNVAGYDLHKLLTGSFGTLGVIVEVNFRLHPIERNVRTWTAIAPNAALFTEPLRALMDSQLTPSCVQLRTSKRESALDIRIAGLPECLDQYAIRLQNLLGEFPIFESEDAVWLERQRVFHNDDCVVLKASLLPSSICSVSEDLQQWAVAEGLELASVAQATGLMMIALNCVPNAQITGIEILRARVLHSGGQVVALKVSDAIRGNLNLWGPEPSALPLMREIKHRFDPGHTLNPGRFVGDI